MNKSIFFKLVLDTQKFLALSEISGPKLFQRELTQTATIKTDKLHIVRLLLFSKILLTRFFPIPFLLKIILIQICCRSERSISTNYENLILGVGSEDTTKNMLSNFIPQNRATVVFLPSFFQFNSIKKSGFCRFSFSDFVTLIVNFYTSAIGVWRWSSSIEKSPEYRALLYLLNTRWSWITSGSQIIFEHQITKIISLNHFRFVYFPLEGRRWEQIAVQACSKSGASSIAVNHCNLDQSHIWFSASNLNKMKWRPDEIIALPEHHERLAQLFINSKITIAHNRRSIQFIGEKKDSLLICLTSDVDDACLICDLCLGLNYEPSQIYIRPNIYHVSNSQIGKIVSVRGLQLFTPEIINFLPRKVATNSLSVFNSMDKLEIDSCLFIRDEKISKSSIQMNRRSSVINLDGEFKEVLAKFNEFTSQSIC